MVSLTDMQIAIKLSTFAYEDCQVGDKIPGTSFKVTFVHEDKIFDHKNDPGFKVVLAEQNKVTYVAYRGTDT